MASPVTRELEERISCKICYTLFKDPRQLSCQHTFCLDCIGQLLVDNCGDIKVSCPLCKSYTILPKSGIKCFPCDHKVNRLIEKFKKIPKDIVTRTKESLPDLSLTKKILPECSKCPSGAKYLCIDCEMPLCQKCKEEHESENLRNYDDHHILALRKDLHCAIHTGNFVSGVCADCKKSLCPVCTNKHKSGHDVLRLKMHNRYREKLKVEIDALSNRIHLFEISVAETQKMLAYYTDIIGNVRSTFSDISTKVMSTIIALEEQCLSNVQKACKRNAEQMNLNFLDDLTSSKMQHLMSDLRVALASPPDQCLMAFTDLCTSSQALRSQEVPDTKMDKMLDKLKREDVVQPTLNYFLGEFDVLCDSVKSRIEKLSGHAKQRLEELDMWHIENTEFSELDLDDIGTTDSASDLCQSSPMTQSDGDNDDQVVCTTTEEGEGKPELEADTGTPCREHLDD